MPGGIGYPLDSYAKGFSSMSSQHGFPLSQASPGARVIRYSRVLCQHGMDSATAACGGRSSTPAVPSPASDACRALTGGGTAAFERGRLRQRRRAATQIQGPPDQSFPPRFGLVRTAALNGEERPDPQCGLPAGHVLPFHGDVPKVPATRPEERGRWSLNRAGRAGRRCRSGSRALAARMTAVMKQPSIIGCYQGMDHQDAKGDGANGANARRDHGDLGALVVWTLSQWAGSWDALG